MMIPYPFMPQWTPHNIAGRKIDVSGRIGEITEVNPPKDFSEAERIVVRFEDGNTEEIIVREIRIGGDRVR